MDALEVAQAITVEAIRAGVNRPDEIKELFNTVLENAHWFHLGQPISLDDKIREEARRLRDTTVEPTHDPQATDAPREPPEAPREAPLPSVAWPEPVPQEEELKGHLTPEEIKAVTRDNCLICLECGKPFTRLKGHLRRTHDMMPHDYISKWGLPRKYPMVPKNEREYLSQRTKRLTQEGKFGAPLIHAALEVKKAEAASKPEPEPRHLTQEEIDASHGDDFIRCLECGVEKQQLRQHLRQIHHTDVQEYKAKWGLPADYPMVSPNLSRKHSERAQRAYVQNMEAGKGLAANQFRGGRV